MGTRISTTSHVILPLGVALSAINSANQNTTEVPLSLNGALQGLEQEFADTVWKTGSGLHNLINGSYSAQDIGRTVPYLPHSYHKRTRPNAFTIPAKQAQQGSPHSNSLHRFIKWVVGVLDPSARKR